MACSMAFLPDNTFDFISEDNENISRFLVMEINSFIPNG